MGSDGLAAAEVGIRAAGRTPRLLGAERWHSAVSVFIFDVPSLEKISEIFARPRISKCCECFFLWQDHCFRDKKQKV